MVDFAKALKRKAQSAPVLLVDGLNCLIRQHFAHSDLRSPSGAPTGAIFGVVNRVREAIDKFTPSRVVVCWDGGRSSWRRAVFAGYKDRPRSESRADLSECFTQREPLRALLGQMGCDQVEVEGVEADDLIAWCVKCSTPSVAVVIPNPVNAEIVILSSDRDFYQLVDAHASVYLGVSAGKGRTVEHVTLETFREATTSAALPAGTADPGEWAAYRVVNGDASDCIPSVRGLGGEKRWPMVRETLSDLGYRGDVQDFFIARDVTDLAHDAGMAVGRYQFGTAVSENWALLERNAVLQSLSFAVGMLERRKVDPAKALVAGRWGERAFEIACGRYAFRSALQDWGAWRGTFRGLAERRG